MKIYITRNADGTMFSFFKHPKKEGDKWIGHKPFPIYFPSKFPEVKWEDEEPLIKEMR